MIKDNSIVDGEMGAIKIFSTDGAEVEDIEISNIEIQSATNPLFIRLGERGNIYGEYPAKKSGGIRKITIDGMRGKIRNRATPVQAAHLPGGSVPVFAHNCLAIMGLPGNPVKDITIRNVDLTLPGGSGNPGWNEIPERAEGYPEIGYYGILPAWGIYMRHVEKADIAECATNLTAPDIRRQHVLEDVLEINGI